MKKSRAEAGPKPDLQKKAFAKIHGPMQRENKLVVITGAGRGSAAQWPLLSPASAPISPCSPSTRGVAQDALLVKVQDGRVVGKMSMDQWRAVVDVNLTGVFLDAMKPEMIERAVSTVPLKRMAEPAEMAHAAIFIAENDYFSGRVVEVDGGQRI